MNFIPLPVLVSPTDSYLHKQLNRNFTPHVPSCGQETYHFVCEPELRMFAFRLEKVHSQRWTYFLLFFNYFLGIIKEKCTKSSTHRKNGFVPRVRFSPSDSAETTTLWLTSDCQSSVLFRATSFWIGNYVLVAVCSTASFDIVLKRGKTNLIIYHFDRI